MGSKVQSTIGCLPYLFSSLFCGTGACGVATAIYKQLCFPAWVSAADFNNNNSNSFLCQSLWGDSGNGQKIVSNPHESSQLICCREFRNEF